jgi:hypothetical protein
MAKSDLGGTLVAAGALAVIAWFVLASKPSASHKITDGNAYSGPQDLPDQIGAIADLSAIFKTKGVDPASIPAAQPFPTSSGDSNGICVPLFGCT